MDREEKFPEIFYPNLIYAMLRQAAEDYFDPRYHIEVTKWLQSDFALWITNGVSAKVLDICKAGNRPTTKIVKARRDSYDS